MKYLFKFPSIIGALLIAALLFANLLTPSAAGTLFLCGWMLSLLSMPQSVMLFDTPIDPQIKEFKELMGDISKAWPQMKGLVVAIDGLLKDVPENERPGLIKSLSDGAKKTSDDLDKLRKGRLTTPAQKGLLRTGQYVSDDCAKFLAAMAIQAGEMQGKFIGLDSHHRDVLIGRAVEILGITQRAALTTSDIPMPTDFGAEVVELVWQYGQARKYGTIYPLGTQITKLPRLKTSPAFGLIGASATVTEKSPQYEFVTFNASKWGGLVRVPSEIDADSIVPLGQFLARYVAREMAKIEDTVFWIADGSGTYASLKGAGKAALDLGFNLTLPGGKPRPSDITLQNLRDLRGKIATSAYQGAAYHMNATMEALLVSFNTSATVTPYIANGPNGPTLDGFPVRWVDVMPIYETNARVGQLQVVFGDASYEYLGVRPGMSIEQSRDVFFATDEIALRALERFTTGLMADQSLAVLQLALS